MIKKIIGNGIISLSQIIMACYIGVRIESVLLSYIKK